MNKVFFDGGIKIILDSLLLDFAFVRGGKMFGYPGYYLGKKLFACVYEDGVGLKLPLEQVNAVLDGKTYTPFIPMGRHVMKEWVYISRIAPEDYRLDLNLFSASIGFVGKNPQ